MERGLYSAGEAKRIRDQAERVVERLLSMQHTEAKTWATWRPPQNWQLPALLPNWKDCDT